MTKVKVFSGINYIEVETAVNEFISNSNFEVMDIKFCNADEFFQMLVIYKDHTEENRLRREAWEAISQSLKHGVNK